MRFVQRFAAMVMVGLLASCGGGGSDPYPTGNTGGDGTGGGTTPSAKLTVALSSTTVTSASPATVTATLVDGTDTVIPNAVLTFSTTGGLGSFNTSTALTDASGVARVTLFPAASTTTGADEVVVAATVDGVALTASRGFQLTATNVSIASFTSDVGAGKLSAYGQTNLNLAVGGAASGASVTVGVSSVCAAKGKATLTPASATTTSSALSFTYRDQGCGATDDTDIVQATISGTTESATLNLGLTSPTVSSVTFVSAAPSTIYLKGSGFTESSQVTFQVRDLAGNPLPNQSVVLQATTLSGGLTVDGKSGAVTKKSDSSGNVTVIVNSGTVPTPVRVKATLGTVTTVSSSLSIAVGLPSELNFSLAQKTLNIEGGNIDGTENTYTVIASDRLGNPVPDLTSINFVAEGGQIEAVGQTSGNPSNGTATVKYHSSEPRPDERRVTIVAYALGEESFLDTNGNNVYDAGEAFQDLGDIFLNRAYDGKYDPVVDQFISLSIAANSTCASVPKAKDPLGLLSLTNRVDIPSIAGSCDGVWGRAYVRRATETVLSYSSARPLWPLGTSASRFNHLCATVPLRTRPGLRRPDKTFFAVGPGGLYRLPAKGGGFTFLVADANDVRLNPVAAGSLIAVTATTGLTAIVTGGSPVANSSEVTAAGVALGFAPGVTSGVVTINITSPSGLTTSTPVAVSTGSPASDCHP